MTDNNGNLQHAEPYKSSSDCAIDRGSLAFLKTKLETRAGDNVMSVHVTAVPVKLASTAIGYVSLSSVPRQFINEPPG